jgi:hypothetical protein
MGHDPRERDENPEDFHSLLLCIGGAGFETLQMAVRMSVSEIMFCMR